jgi:two-component system, OmpR family, copper resistance phosphate regulon response regulator CusR
MKILVVEDEKKVAAFIQRGLESENFTVEAAYNGNDGLKLAYDTSFDIIILDLMLPGIDGLTLLQRLRESDVHTPVLILTARGETEDRIGGLNLGADDYLVKPFAFGELLARLRALVRRSYNQTNTLLGYGDLTINLQTHEVNRADERIELTPKEYALLEFLVLNVNRALNRVSIAEHVWNYDFDRGTNFIDVHINRLRKKIDEGYEDKHIQTVRGYGYIFKP